MKVKITGFSWVMGNGVTTTSLLEFMEKRSPFRHSNKIFSITRRDDYWAGVLLTIRDHSSICLIKPGEENAFEVVSEALERDEKLVEFNFFLFKEKTGRGLYQQYRGSSTLNTFCLLATRLYNEHRRELRAAALAQPKADRKEVSKQFRGTLTYQVMVKPENFPALVNKLAKIKAFQVQLATVKPLEKAFQPVADIASHISERFTFSSDKKVLSAARKAILAIVSKLDLNTATVFGVDANGVDTSVKLLENPDVFATYEYDELASRLKLLSSDLNATILGSTTVTYLAAVAQSGKIKALLNTPTS